MSKILIIEDDPMLQGLYKEIFERQGFVAVIAGDGKTGLHDAANEQPDFILLDVMLPKEDGISVLTHLKENALTSKIPVALLTAIPEGPPLTIDPALRKTLVGYWVKDSLKPDELVDRVKDFLVLQPQASS